MKKAPYKVESFRVIDICYYLGLAPNTGGRGRTDTPEGTRF
jgi:hypothetical protein